MQRTSKLDAITPARFRDALSRCIAAGTWRRTEKSWSGPASASGGRLCPRQITTSIGNIRLELRFPAQLYGTGSKRLKSLQRSDPSFYRIDAEPQPGQTCEKRI
jgi:hypothetical protein